MVPSGHYVSEKLWALNTSVSICRCVFAKTIIFALNPQIHACKWTFMSSSNNFGVLAISRTCTIGKQDVEKNNDNTGAKPYTSIGLKKLV